MNVRTMTRWTAIAAALLVSSMGSVATAQWGDPEGGDNWQAPPDQQQQQQQPPPDQQQQQGWQQQQQQPQQQAGWQQQQQQQQQQETPAWGSTDTEQPPSVGGSAGGSGESDHQRVVGHLGVGWLGLMDVSVGAGDASVGVGASRSISAPIIGMRYWLSEGLGLDIGLGFGYSKVSGEGGMGAVSVSVIDESGFAFVLHGGIPLAIYNDTHYKFLLIPEVNFAIGSYTILADIADNDQDLSGLLFTLGGRIGAEIHFGFIDVPDLALQATVGLALAVASGSWETNFGDDFIDTSSLDVHTNIQPEPWDIFTGSIAAIYYFR